MGGYKRDYRKKKKPKPFGTIEVATVESDEWSKLDKLEALVYHTLKTFYRGREQKSFRAGFDRIKKRSRIKEGRTVHRAIMGLEEKEWIMVTRYAKHGKRRGLRIRPNEYQLTLKFDIMHW